MQQLYLFMYINAQREYVEDGENVLEQYIFFPFLPHTALSHSLLYIQSVYDLYLSNTST